MACEHAVGASNAVLAILQSAPNADLGVQAAALAVARFCQLNKLDLEDFLDQARRAHAVALEYAQTETV